MREQQQRHNNKHRYQQHQDHHPQPPQRRQQHRKQGRSSESARTSSRGSRPYALPPNQAIETNPVAIAAANYGIKKETIMSAVHPEHSHQPQPQFAQYQQHHIQQDQHYIQYYNSPSPNFTSSYPYPPYDPYSQFHPPQQRFYNAPHYQPIYRGHYLGDGSSNAREDNGNNAVSDLTRNQTLAPILNRMRTQIDFYFSSTNLLKDKYLQSIMSENLIASGAPAVPVHTVCQFPKIRHLYAEGIATYNNAAGRPQYVAASGNTIRYDSSTTSDIAAIPAENTPNAFQPQDENQPADPQWLVAAILLHRSDGASSAHLSDDGQWILPTQETVNLVLPVLFQNQQQIPPTAQYLVAGDPYESECGLGTFKVAQMPQDPSTAARAFASPVANTPSTAVSSSSSTASSRTSPRNNQSLIETAEQGDECSQHQQHLVQPGEQYKQEVRGATTPASSSLAVSSPAPSPSPCSLATDETSEGVPTHPFPPAAPGNMVETKMIEVRNVPNHISRDELAHCFGELSKGIKEMSLCGGPDVTNPLVNDGHSTVTTGTSVWHLAFSSSTEAEKVLLFCRDKKLAGQRVEAQLLSPSSPSAPDTHQGPNTPLHLPVTGPVDTNSAVSHDQNQHQLHYSLTAHPVYNAHQGYYQPYQAPVYGYPARVAAEEYQHLQHDYEHYLHPPVVAQMEAHDDSRTVPMTPYCDERELGETSRLSTTNSSHPEEEASKPLWNDQVGPTIDAAASSQKFVAEQRISQDTRKVPSSVNYSTVSADKDEEKKVDDSNSMQQADYNGPPLNVFVKNAAGDPPLTGVAFDEKADTKGGAGRENAAAVVASEKRVAEIGDEPEQKHGQTKIRSSNEKATSNVSKNAVKMDDGRRRGHNHHGHHRHYQRRQQYHHRNHQVDNSGKHNVMTSEQGGNAVHNGNTVSAANGPAKGNYRRQYKQQQQHHGRLPKVKEAVGGAVADGEHESVRANSATSARSVDVSLSSQDGSALVNCAASGATHAQQPHEGKSWNNYNRDRKKHNYNYSHRHQYHGHYAHGRHKLGAGQGAKQVPATGNLSDRDEHFPALSQQGSSGKKSWTNKKEAIRSQNKPGHAKNDRPAYAEALLKRPSNK